MTVEQAQTGTPATQGGYKDSEAVIAKTATIYPNAWIGPGVEVGDDASIGPGAVVGFSRDDGQAGVTRIGAGTSIGPNVCVETGVVIGRGCKVGFASSLGAGSQLQEEVTIGQRCTLMGHCQIGSYVLLYAEVHVCEHAQLGSHCQIMPGAILMNEPYPPTGLAVRGPVIGQCAIVGVRTLIWPGVTMGYHAMAAAMSEVKHDVPDYALVRGRPAKCICDVRQIRTKLADKWVYPYPWMRHHTPDEDITRPAT